MISHRPARTRVDRACNPLGTAIPEDKKKLLSGTDCLLRSLKISDLSAVDRSYTLNELPQPQVLFTFGLLNLNPAPSSVSM